MFVKMHLQEAFSLRSKDEETKPALEIIKHRTGG